METEKNLIAEISDILGIGSTGSKILHLLAKAKKKLSVNEIIAGIKRSERSVKAHLKVLIDLNLIQREITVTEKGRLAYRYFRLQTDELVDSARKEVLRRLRSLEKRVR
jgi:predicted transcriptional regulator